MHGPSANSPETPPASPPSWLRRSSAWCLALVARRRGLLTALFVTGLGIFAHRENFGYGILGFDSYVQIYAARIGSAGDFLDTFQRELADGIIAPSFYRPVQNLSIALDYWLWGLTPLGYQLQTMLVFAATILLVYAATRRLLGPQVWVGPTVAAALVALHPTLLNVLPTPCRRSDLLMAAFLFAGLLVLPQRGDRRTTLRLWAGAILMLLGAASKDVGILGVGLVFLHQFALRYEGGMWARFRGAWIATLPALLAVGAYMINRNFVLGGVGGYPPKHELTYPERLQVFGSLALQDVFCPYLFFPQGWLPPGWSALQVSILSALALAAVGLFFVVLALLSRIDGRRRVGVLVGMAAIWVAPSVVLLGAMLWYGPWYAVVPTVGVALLLGAVAQGAAHLLRGGALEKLVGAASAAVVPAVLLLALYCSPIHIFYTEWSLATKSLDSTLNELDAQMAKARPGDRIDVSCYPYVYVQNEIDRPKLRFVATIMVRGVRAYLQMRYPEKQTRVVGGSVRGFGVRRDIRRANAPIFVRLVTPPY
jgi:hypothetical protein